MLDLKQQIESGALKRGDKLQAEQEYAAAYGTSTITVRKALELLVAEKLVHRIKGKGSYVSTPDAQADNSHLMAVVFSIEDYHDASFMQIVMGLQRTLAQMHYSLIVEWNNRNLEDEHASIRNLIQRQVEGVFLYPYDPDASVGDYRLLEQAGIPYIVLDHHSHNHPTHFVSCDNRTGGALATAHMIAMHHRKLRFVNFEFNFSSEQERYEAFYNTMRKHGLCRHDETLMLCYSEIDFDALAADIRRGEITGLVCVNDKMAIQCIRQLMARGLRVPEDVSIIGFDDWERNSTSPVPLTTIRQSFVNLGTCAALLMRMLHECPIQENCTLLTGVELICRESVRALPAEA